MQFRFMTSPLVCYGRMPDQTELDYLEHRNDCFKCFKSKRSPLIRLYMLNLQIVENPARFVLRFKAFIMTEPLLIVRLRPSSTLKGSPTLKRSAPSCSSTSTQPQEPHA
jgi:hypothetical protein